MPNAADHILRCLLADGNIRVIAAVTTSVARETARRHETTGAVSVALGRAATAGLLLATLTKDEERVTLQILGDGPLGSVVVDAAASGKVRAYPRHRELVLPGGPGKRVPLAPFVGRSGVVGVVRDVGLARPFSGQTEIVDGEIDTDVEAYLNKSEQIESALACDTLLDGQQEIATSAGVLVQALPGTSQARTVASARARLRSGALTEALLQASGALSAEALTRAVLGDLGTSLQVLDSRPVVFACPCTRERAGASLALLGEADLTDMLATEGQAEITCEFCREVYVFGADDLAAARAQVKTSTQRPS